jgi:hypothetical protein
VTANYAGNYGVYLGDSFNVVGDTIVTNYCSNRGTYIQLCPGIKVTTITSNNNNYNGIYLGSCAGAILSDINIANTGNYGMTIAESINVKITDLTTSNNTGGAIWPPQSQVYLNNPSIAEAIPVVFDTSSYFGVDNFVSAKKYAQTAGDHRIFMAQGTVTSEAATRHTASGLAWKMTPLIANQKMRLLPNNFKAAVLANKEVTIGVYVRKNADYAGNAPRLVLLGGILSGIAADVIDTLTVAADNWELLEVSGTPTEDGVLEFYVDCDGVAGAVFVDDFAIVQAA